MNELGFRTRNRSKFSDTTVDRLLRDPIAKGQRRSNYTKSLGKGKKSKTKPTSDWVFVGVEPTVSTELWAQCKAILDEQEKSRKPSAKKTVHLFSGYAICHCGGKMYVPSNVPKYVCGKCRNKIKVEDLESLFHEQLKSLFVSPDEVTE